MTANQRRLQKKRHLATGELHLLELTTKFCNKKQFYAISRLLKSGIDPNMPNARELGIKFNSLPIGNAALRGNASLIELLLSFGADPTATFKLGKHLTQAMHCAARGRYQKKGFQGDYTNTIYALYRRGANPSAGGNKKLPFTPLHFLALQKKRIPWNRQREIALALFTVDALPDKESFDGKTVEQIARLAKLPKLANLLNERTQEAQRDSCLFNKFSNAFQQGNLKAASLIISKAKAKRNKLCPLDIRDALDRLYKQQGHSQKTGYHASSSSNN